MKASELRIGNWVCAEQLNSKEYQIEGWMFAEIDSEIPSIDHADGIPLTEEWLLRLGLKYGSGKYTIDLIDVEKNGSGLEVSVPDGGQESWPKYLHHIKYVHQLQNLYFALTGEELIVTT